MDKITMLGTGHAMTVDCFNTCFVYENECGKMLVDTGGGQQLVRQLRKAHISAADISHVFLTHRHTDHFLGLPWLLRMRMQDLETHPLEILTHAELCKSAEALLGLVLPEALKYLGKGLTITSVGHGEEKTVLGRDIQFYDTGSERCKQYGFVMTLADGGKFVFNGDVPYCEANKEIMCNAKWLMHEAFRLQDDWGIENGEGVRQAPKKGHSSVFEVAGYAAQLAAECLILVHGGDNDLEHRKARYIAEATRQFSGPILAPDDFDVIEL